VAQAGIDTSAPGHAVLGFDVMFKSVSRQVYNPLIGGSLSMDDSAPDLGVVIVASSGTPSPDGQAVDASGNAIGADGAAFQQGSVSGASAAGPRGFPNTTRKPSAPSTYDAEVNADPDLAEPSDLSQAVALENGVAAYNQELAPAVTGALGAPQQPLQPNTNGGLLNQLVGDTLANTIANPQQALGNLAAKAASAAGNVLRADLHKAEQLLRQKRNELVRQFVNDLEVKVGLKKIIPSNVYTDPNYFAEIGSPVDQLTSAVGLTVGQAIIQNLTGG
jgi:hypothetical protein